MYHHKIIADRKMCGYSGTDCYIDLKNVNNFKDIWSQINIDTITTINSEPIVKDAGLFKFNLIDNFTKKKYESNIADLGKSIRFRITNYSKDINLTPSNILYITMDINGSNCNLGIKLENLYKYILKKVPRTDDKYYLVEEHEREETIVTFETYLNEFELSLVGTSLPIGKSQLTYEMYTLNDCRKKYIGIPFDTNLEVDCFNEIEEIL